MRYLLILLTMATVAAKTPSGVSAGDWAQIRAEYERHRHAVFASGGGYQARNHAQQWLTRFDGRSFAVKPDSGNWSWGLRLESYGYAGHERRVKQARATAAVEKFAYQWDSVMTEWFVNGRSGLEHGFTLASRPGRSTEPLLLHLAVTGSLKPQVTADGRDVKFVNANGQTVVHYDGLKVTDAEGRRLSARFVPDVGGLQLEVEDTDAKYPVTIDPVAQQAYLKASNTEAGDDFGGSVAVSGDTVVVGALAEDSNATGVNGDGSDNSAFGSGAAYVFVRTGGTWTQQAYLKASNTGLFDNFGVSVAVSGDTVVVGAPFEGSNATGVNGDGSNNSAGNSGAAYVFVRTGGTWTQQAYLKASNTGEDDNFGFSVAVSVNTVVVGARAEDSNATGVNGDGSNNSAGNSGAAYVFVRTGGTWTQQAYLKASNTEALDIFGVSVAVSGDTVVVGAYGEDSNATGVNGDGSDNSAFTSGAAYVFVRTAGTWTQQAYLKASNTGSDDSFGWSVAVSGETVVVGAYGEDSNATGVNGDGSNNSAQASGAAYVFVRTGGTWTQQAYMKASNTETSDLFGLSVAVSGDTVVVGADAEDSNATGVNGDGSNNSAGNSGAAYVFVRTGGTWTQQAYLKASNTGTSDLFGTSVAVSGDTVVVGAYDEDSNATGVNGDGSNNAAFTSGAAYIFTLAASAETTTTTVSSSLNPSVVTQSVIFTATVTASGSPVTTGTVTFFEGALVLAGSVPLNVAGQAQFSTTSLTPGPHTIRAEYNGVPRTFAPSSGTVSQLVVYADPPLITKAFGAVSIGVGGSTTLTFNISNPNALMLTGISFSDTLPAGLQVALPNGVGGTCAASVSAPPGDTVIGVTNLNLAASTSCTITVNVQGAAPGLQNNVTSTITSNQSLPGAPATASINVGDPLQISYFPNLNVGDGVINVTNPGSLGAGLAAGTSASTTGAICLNVYAFSPDEQLISCCSCPVTPNGLVSLSARNDLISNTLTPAVPTSIVVKLLATVPVGGSCAGSAGSVASRTLANSLNAWGTKIHARPGAGFAVTETAFVGATLSAGELNRLSTLCSFIDANGSGFGICRSCRLGGLGAGRF